MVTGMRPGKRPVQRKRYFWAPRIVAAAVVLFPLSLQKIDFRNVFGEGLSVAAYKASPAYAAFEDLHENYRSTFPAFPEKLEVLSAGKHRYVPPASHPAVAIRVVSLKGTTIKTPGAQQPQPFYVAGQTKLQDLPIPQRKAVLAHEVRREGWEIPNPAQLAQELVEAEQKNIPLAARPSPDQRIIRTASGNPIVVARGNIAPPKLPPVDPSKTSPVEVHETFGFMSHVTKVEPKPDQLRPLWLNGQIEMTGGLAFTGRETQMVVKRVLDGQILERGRIWVSEGRFEIHVKSAIGQLVAELTTPEGRVLGRGEMNLVHLKDIPTSDNRIYDIRIALRPTAEGATIRAVSGYSHGQQMMPVREARIEIQDYMEAQKVNDEGFISESTLNAKSTFVARASAPKHWSSIVIGQAEKPQDIRLFSNSLIEALINLETSGVGEAKVAGKSGIVWGQIRRDGKAASGVSVQMAGSYQAIYFNEAYIPDTRLKATSGNGLFAIINVKRGVQALRVKSEGRTYPAQVFPTEDRHVSYVELDLEERVVTQFKVIDVLNMNSPIEARIRMVGTEEVVPLRHSGMVEYSNGANPFMVEAEAGVEYEVSRVTLSGRPQNVHIPMVRRDWLTNIYNSQNILALPGRGIIVGFVDDEDFEVELTGYSAQEKMQIIYFDARGNVVPDRKSGLAGGGFVVFNAPLGLQTVYLHPLQSKETFSQVVVAEPEYVHVMTWSQKR